jgi:hypothetical protein
MGEALPFAVLGLKMRAKFVRSGGPMTRLSMIVLSHSCCRDYCSYLSM